MHTPSILLVTNAYHIKRAKKTLERQVFKVNPYPVDFKTNPKNVNLKKPYKLIPNSESLDSNSKAIRKMIGRSISKAW
ncbi:YdcF family protein [Prochlorococcus marinus]|uniref:YdcF family protein n=1 Tax=Prochlorococcus marinus TaxID=1219 RepID=UPI0022B592E6|nr:ElyC/SanA/YdcF family protein [Prochlorococcus marinus]